MTESDAYEVTTLLRAAIAGRVDQSTIDYYQAALLPLDYDIALTTATIGTITWRRFPSWAEFKEVYRAQERLARPQESPFPPDQPGKPPTTDDTEFKRGVQVADWVHVYYWCRMERDPTTMESFPQQEGHVDPASVMSQERYEELRKEWKESGEPRYEKPIPMAR